MSLTETTEQIENLFDTCTDNSDKIAGAELLEKINKELEVFFSIETNKKHFIRALSRIFALLLNTKVDTTEKIKRYSKSQ